MLRARGNLAYDKFRSTIDFETSSESKLPHAPPSLASNYSSLDPVDRWKAPTIVAADGGVQGEFREFDAARGRDMLEDRPVRVVMWHTTSELARAWKQTLSPSAFTPAARTNTSNTYSTNNTSFARRS